MSSSDPLMLSITFISVGILFFFVGLLIFKWKRLIEDIPTSKIRSIAMGLVEIFGEVVSSKDNIMKSPLSQSGCVYYRYLIEEYRSSGKSSHWIPIKKGWDCQLFYLKDDTGMVLINPRKAKVDIPVDIRLESGFRKDPPEYVKSFLKQNNIKYEGLLGANKTMRYTEHLIEPEDKLFIIGTATDNPHI